MKIEQVPLVSVVMITYKHEAFIKLAIESVLMQKCDFNVELIVADDNAPDNSEEVINEIIQQHPNGHWIKYIKHVVNKGMAGNFTWALTQAKGKYLAVCDGDDYWTDSLKLQKQVNFLEEHLDYNIVMGRYKFLYENSGILKDSVELFDIGKDLYLKDYIAFNFSHISTILFRNNLQSLPEWLLHTFALDQSLVIIVAEEKKIKYLSDFLSIYRVNDGGITHSVQPKKSIENTNTFLNQINTYTKGKFQLLINNRKLLNKLYFIFESTNSKILKTLMKIPIVLVRWFGINVLIKFVK